MAQVPNGGFEDWEGGDHEDPVQWITTNNIAAANDMEPTCEKISPGVAGLYCAKVTSRSGPDGIIAFGTMVTGNPDSNRRGYPFNSRPDALLGHWKYRIMPFDLGQLSVTLSHWDGIANSRVVVGNASVWITDSIADWEPFQLHINYALTDLPDTAVVSVAASASPFAVVAGSTVQLDEMKFSDASGISDVGVDKGFRLFPSPTVGPLTLECSSTPVSFIIRDVTGREVRHVPARAETNIMDVSELDAGRYVMQVHLRDGRYLVRSFVKE